MTTASFTQRHVTLKALYGFHCTSRSSKASWNELFGWILKKETLQWFPQLHQCGAVTENPSLGSQWNCWPAILSRVFALMSNMKLKCFVMEKNLKPVCSRTVNDVILYNETEWIVLQEMECVEWALSKKLFENKLYEKHMADGPFHFRSVLMWSLITVWIYF